MRLTGSRRCDASPRSGGVTLPIEGEMTRELPAQPVCPTRRVTAMPRETAGLSVMPCAGTCLLEFVGPVCEERACRW